MRAKEKDGQSIQKIWAGLIANASDPDPNKRINPKKIYIEILDSLEPLDAKVLKLLTSPSNQGINMMTLIEATGENEKDLQLSLQNLARLGCITAVRQMNHRVWVDFSSFGAYLTAESATLKSTPLGFELIKACETE